MPLSNKRLRDLLRVAHIGAAFATCAFVYSPFAGEPGFAPASNGRIGDGCVVP